MHLAFFAVRGSQVESYDVTAVATCPLSSASEDEVRARVTFAVSDPTSGLELERSHTGTRTLRFG